MEASRRIDFSRGGDSSAVSHWATTSATSFRPRAQSAGTRPRPQLTGFSSNVHPSVGTRNAPLSLEKPEVTGVRDVPLLDHASQGLLERQSLGKASFQNPRDHRSAREVARLKEKLRDPSMASKTRTGFFANTNVPEASTFRRAGTSLGRTMAGWEDEDVATTSGAAFARPRTAPAQEVLSDFARRDEKHKDTGFSRATMLTHIRGSMRKEKSMTQKQFSRKHMDRANTNPEETKERYLQRKACLGSTSTDLLRSIPSSSMGRHPAVNPRYDPGQDARSLSGFTNSCFSAANYQPFKQNQMGEGDDQLHASVVQTMRVKDPTAFGNWLVPHSHLSTTKMAYSAAPMGGLAPRPGTDQDPRRLDKMPTGFANERPMQLRLQALEKQPVTTHRKMFKQPASQRLMSKRNPDVLLHTQGMGPQEVADLLAPGARLGDTKRMMEQGERIVPEANRQLPARAPVRSITSRMVASTGHHYKENSILDTGKYSTPLETGKPEETLQGVHPTVQRMLERSNQAEYGKDSFDRSHKKRNPNLVPPKKGAHGKFQSTMPRR